MPVVGTAPARMNLNFGKVNKLVTCIMFLSVIVHLFYSSGYLLDYYLHTEAYRAHCINQEKPELHCDGKCLLAQKIRAAQKEQNPDPESATLPVSPEYLVGMIFTVFWFSKGLPSREPFRKREAIRRFSAGIFIPPEVEGSHSQHQAGILWNAAHLIFHYGSS